MDGLGVSRVRVEGFGFKALREGLGVWPPRPCTLNPKP